MTKARDDLSQINMKLLRAALDEGLGRDYEYQDYVRWVGETERNFFAVMRCRSIEPNPSAQRAALGADRVATRAAMLRYVTLVDGEKELLDVVDRSIRERSVAPLVAYRAALAPGQDPKLTATVEKVATLIGVPAPPAEMTAPASIAVITGPSGKTIRPPHSGRAGQRWTSPTDGRVMAWAPSGTFEMGQRLPPPDPKKGSSSI